MTVYRWDVEKAAGPRLVSRSVLDMVGEDTAVGTARYPTIRAVQPAAD